MGMGKNKSNQFAYVEKKIKTYTASTNTTISIKVKAAGIDFRGVPTAQWRIVPYLFNHCTPWSLISKHLQYDDVL